MRCSPKNGISDQTGVYIRITRRHLIPITGVSRCHIKDYNVRLEAWNLGKSRFGIVRMVNNKQIICAGDDAAETFGNDRMRVENVELGFHCRTTFYTIC